MAKLTREQIEKHRALIGFDKELHPSPEFHRALCDMALRACDAPEVARDAERYRWVRDTDPDNEAWENLIENVRSEDWDAAIDAAMQAGRKHD